MTDCAVLFEIPCFAHLLSIFAQIDSGSNDVSGAHVTAKSTRCLFRATFYFLHQPMPQFKLSLPSTSASIRPIFPPQPTVWHVRSRYTCCSLLQLHVICWRRGFRQGRLFTQIFPYEDTAYLHGAFRYRGLLFHGQHPEEEGGS